jgi:hypothetical protein
MKSCYDIKTLVEADSKKALSKVKQMKQNSGMTQTGQKANSVETEPEITGTMGVGVGLSGR